MIRAGINSGPLDVRFSGGVGANRQNGNGFGVGQGDGVTLVAWMFREQLTSALLGEIGRLAAKPIPPQERGPRLAALQAQRLDLQYIEEKLIVEALDRGETVTRSIDSPPICVLGIKVKLPDHVSEAAE
jgi:hypothetical protein